MLFLPSRRGIPPYIGRHPLWQIAGQVPAFHLDFTTGQVIERIGGRLGTFTRPSSVKNVWNGSQFVSVAADTPALQRDPATELWGYLHEPAATNLYINSNTPGNRTITVTAQQYTLSFYGTGTLTLSGASTAGPLVGAGAEPNRVSLTFTPSAGNLTLTLSGSISRPQLETGPVATSPIITAGSAATRAVDTWTWTGAQFSDWYNQAGGVFVAEYSPSGIPQPAGGRVWDVSDNTANQTMRLLAVGGTIPAFATFNGNVLQASLAHPTLLDTSRRKTASRAAADNFASSENGATLLTDTSGTVPVVNRMAIGAASSAGGGNAGNYLIHQFAYLPPGPAVNRIQALSAL